MKDDHSHFFEVALSRSLGKNVKIIQYQFTSGGCINHSARLISSVGSYFIKWNEADKGNLFSAEAKGLQLLSNTKTIKIPEIIGYGSIEDKVFLILEYIKSSTADDYFWADLGSSLSDLHHYSNDFFGLDHDNYIGSLYQNNTMMKSWIQFFIEKRLEVQISIAYEKGLVSDSFLKKFKNLYEKLPDLLPVEKPSLLHGDLWSGNIMPIYGKACLIDPAVYYGNREVEIAFTKLFGGFDQLFYNVYNECFPLLPEFEQRAAIYNMYYLLVHVNIFGISYLEPVDRTIKALQ